MDVAAAVTLPESTTPEGPAPAPARPWWRWFRWADLALVPLAIGVVLFVRRYAAHAPLWLDEQMIARNIRDRGFGELAGALDYNQSAPLGWLWAQHALVAVFGTDEYVLRLLPLLASIGTLVLAWLAGRSWLGPVGAVVLVSFVASNASAIRYAAEVKQYSGDLLWTMSLLVATMALLERPRPTARQFVWWWSLAAVACLFSMGAMLATPVFAFVVVATVLLRAGWSAAFRAALPFLIWTAVFAGHYLASLRHVLSSDYMATFWGRRGYPPADGSLRRVAHWSWDRLHVLGVDPLSLAPPGEGRSHIDTVAPIFWLLVAAGCVAAAWQVRPFGALLAGVVVFAYALAFAELVPLYMRMAIWILPAVYVAVAFGADGAARLALGAGRAMARGAPRTWRTGAVLTGGVAGAAAALVVLVMLVPLVVGRVGERPPPPGLDERAAVAWAAGQHRPGDLTLVLTTSRHAVGWYADDELEPRRYPVAVSRLPGRPCTGHDIATLVAGHRRVILYGYYKSAYYTRTAQRLRADLTAIGTVVADGAFPSAVAIVVELRPPAGRAPTTGCYQA
ncbi:hypothetical protein O7635_26835 [Asanoa sp. WMMD1127]|uniref:hypothetical protein n=1 Tax=Asanoa sp. WMMD1127 TaxID=3016107 RepID=UPI0024169CD1|nr:hypothetical protein [Asanoa sp. WMMD1127]MDG4825479.1 hypothetical protein [Asanoa sp. WMMD1127]